MRVIPCILTNKYLIKYFIELLTPNLYFKNNKNNYVS